MATEQSCLFTWDHVDRLPDIVRLARVLDALPDEALVEALERRRGHGRDDDPVRAMWRMAIAGIVFQHRSVAELLRELGRNPALPEACGFHPLDLPGTRRVVQEEDGVIRVILSGPRSTTPSSHNVTRFLQALIVTLREALMAALLRLRRPPGLRRQGDREPFDGPDCRGQGGTLGRGRRPGQARDPWLRRPQRQGLDEGQVVVRHRSAPDRRHA